MDTKKLPITDLRWGLTREQTALRDGAERPLIVERIEIENGGHYYDIIDGHHRVMGMKAAGETIITCIVVNESDCEDAEFAGGDTPEAEWIERIHEEAV